MDNSKEKKNITENINTENNTPETTDAKRWKRFFASTFSMIAILLLGAAGLVIWIDPFFHYHAPFDGVSYVLEDERYQNDGIARHFDYELLIIGTSMCENFRTSQAEELFGMKAVKTPFAGGYFKEISDAEGRALSYNPDIKIVIRSLDQGFAWLDKDKENEIVADAKFLYDDNYFNDLPYIFNHKVLFYYLPETIKRSIDKVPADNFDDYARFAEDRPLGKDVLLARMYHPADPEWQPPYTEEDVELLKENINQNFMKNPADYPDVQFYYFFPPYSVASWYENYYAPCKFNKYMMTFRTMTDMLLEYDNVHIFSFFDETDITGNLDNYSDVAHYSGEVNDQMLIWMAEGSHEITKENKDEYWDMIDEIYRNYDYESMYE